MELLIWIGAEWNWVVPLGMSLFALVNLSAWFSWFFMLKKIDKGQLRIYHRIGALIGMIVGGINTVIYVIIIAMLLHRW